MLLDRRILLSGLAGSVAFLALSGTGIAAEKPINVVTTTGMIADAVRNVGGDLVEVKSLMGPGVDPHAYRQTRTDIVAMTRADLVLWNGLYLEAQLETFLLDLGESSPVVAVAESLPFEMRIQHEDYAGRFDPHIWMDPKYWAYAVKTVQYSIAGTSAVAGVEAPEVIEALDQNAAAYLAEIAKIEQYSIEVLKSIPETSRVLITAHDAFNYFGEAYGFEVIGIQGISTESEAGINRISTLVDLIVDRDIGAVFVESSVSDRSIRALIEGAEAKGHDLKVGGELFSDAMGEPGTYEGTYIGMVDHNVTTIARALGGIAPERGLNGLLSAGS